MLSDVVKGTGNGDALEAQRSSPAMLLALLGSETMRRLQAVHGELDLSPRQFEILNLLHHYDGLPQSALLGELRVAASILVTLLNPLEHAGLIRRERDPDDRRRHMVTLTGAGADALHEASRAHRQIEDEILAALNGSERGQLRELLATVRDSLTAGDRRCATPGSLEKFIDTP